VLLAQLGELFI